MQREKLHFIGGRPDDHKAILESSRARFTIEGMKQRVWDALREMEAEAEPLKRRHAAYALAAFADIEQRADYAFDVLNLAAQQFRRYEQLHRNAGEHTAAANDSLLAEQAERAAKRLTASHS